MNETPVTSRHTRLWIVMTAIVFYVPFQLHYDYLLNLFYHFGAPYNDAGILAEIVWRGDLRLTSPDVFTNYSFLGVHFVPLFILLCELSYFLPTHAPEYYSAFLAATYAGLGVTLFYLFHAFIRPDSPLKILLAALISIGFAFNGVIMDGIWIGHFEYAIPLGILLFLSQYLIKNWAWCGIFFVFTLSVREDAGLHLIAVIGLIGCIRFYRTRSLRAILPEAAIVGVAALYSAVAIWASLYFRGYYGSTFQTIYSGDHFYAHLSLSLLLTRLGAIGREHVYLWLGFAITLIQAIRTRNPYLIVGFAAYIPWFLLNWTALDGNPANLRAYYGFPFIISLAWPVFGIALHRGLPFSKAAAREAATLQGLLVVAGLVMWNEYDHHPEFGPDFGARWGAYALQKGTENRQLLQEFAAKFNAGEGDLGIVMGDDLTLSLLKGVYKGKDMTRTEGKTPSDTLLYMNPRGGAPNQDILDQAHRNGLTRHYCIAGATLCMFTNRDSSKLATFNALFAAAPVPK